MLPSQNKAKTLINKFYKVGIPLTNQQSKEYALISVEETISTLISLRNQFNNAAIRDKITYEIQNQEWIKDSIKKL